MKYHNSYCVEVSVPQAESVHYLFARLRFSLHNDAFILLYVVCIYYYVHWL